MLGLPIRRFRVEDTSMEPALQPGDRLFILIWPRPVRTGDIVVFHDPEAPSTFVIKRVASVGSDGGLELRGDNPNVSRDSRHFGPVSRQLLVGRAVYRYLPAERRGRLLGTFMFPILGGLFLLVLIGVAIVLALRALTEIRQLRSELDETQRQLNELKAATEGMPGPPPPPLPRARTSGLDDLREQLRASHREESSSEESAPG